MLGTVGIILLLDLPVDPFVMMTMIVRATGSSKIVGIGFICIIVTDNVIIFIVNGSGVE